MKLRIGARIPITLVTLTAFALSGCGSTGTAAGQDAVTLRLGYFSNLTHAPALIGLDQGLFKRDLGSNVTLQTQTFNAGGDEMTALIGGSIDAAFVGPSPAINAFSKGGSSVLRIVAGATSGGAGLVVRSSEHITDAAQLKGKTLATPQLGNTQDVALRTYLANHGLHTDLQGGGDVKITPIANATALQLFEQGQIDGGWEPEPYLSEMVNQGGSLLVNEASLWPNGAFPTTELVVATSFLNAHPDTVKALIQGDLDSIDFANQHTTDAKAAVQRQLKLLTQKSLPTNVLDSAWDRLKFTADPLASALVTGTANAKTAGVLKSSVQLKGILDLATLNQLLAARGDPTVTDGGLG